MYRNDAVVVFGWKIHLKIKFWKRVLLTKFHFYIKRFMEISGKGLLFYQQASSLIGNQTCHRTNMYFLINPTLAMNQNMRAFVLWSIAKHVHCSVPLNILSSVLCITESMQYNLMSYYQLLTFWKSNLAPTTPFWKGWIRERSYFLSFFNAYV